VPRVGVVPKYGSGDEVQWFEIEPCFVYHPMNCYEQDDRIVMEACRHTRTFDQNALGPDEGIAPTLDRWTFDRSTGVVKHEQLDERGQEFPRFDERLQGKPYRYGYSVGLDIDRSTGLSVGGLFRHDLRAGSSQHRGDDRFEWAEVVFVPRAADSAEDDGWLMGYRYDRERDASDLVILDSADITGAEVAVVHLPQRVPNGFHGNWVAD